MCCLDLFFFFKQKTAYEMRISDWSSDVCSSDLPFRAGAVAYAAEVAADHDRRQVPAVLGQVDAPGDRAPERPFHRCRVERLQRADAGGGEVAGDAAHAEAVAAVRGDGDVDDRVVEAGPEIGRAHV